MSKIIQAATRIAVALCFVLVLNHTSWAQGATGGVTGTVADPLGARVAGATVRLVQDGRPGATTTADGDGAFAFTGVAEGRYRLEIAAPGFTTRTTDPFFVGPSSRVTQQVTLEIGPLRQAVVVSASAVEMPAAQVGASVSVIEADLLNASGKPDVFEAIRIVPGAQVVQTGARGGATSLFLRGGHPGFTKVLMDGVALNDIGGAFNFSDLEVTGVDRIEVLRGANSVLYGSDALSGVVTLTTPRGRTSRPAWTLATEGGNLGTSRHSASVGGAHKRFDYFSAYSHLDTDNSVPNNAFQNDTFAGRIGFAIGSHTDLSATVRQSVSDLGLPNGISYYGIPDDSSQHTRFTSFGATARSRVTHALSTTVQVSSSEQKLDLTNPTPTGEAFDPFGFGAVYLGEEVSIEAANGTSTTGRAILDYGGTYPSNYRSDSTRRSISGQLDLALNRAFSLAGGVRFDREHGQSDSGTLSSTTRNTGGVFVEARATASRVFVNVGLGYDHNTVFQSAVSPRLSIAAYLRPPSASGALGETKVTFNAGKGLKAPTVSQELSSLYTLVHTTPLGGQVNPIGPERSTGVDVGLSQVVARGHARLGLAYFDNRFEDLIEYVSNTALPQLGVPLDVAETTTYGAYVNASSYTARGVEASVDAVLGRGLRLLASYMFLDAKVTKSFSGDALAPAINPAYPDTPIGTYAPLVGGRPFRRPANSGNIAVSYTSNRIRAFVSAFISGTFDQSTFLSDAFFGSSLLLPNRDFGFGYRKIDANVSYAVTPEVNVYVNIENLANASYEPAAGFPALPRTARAGVRLNLGAK